MWPLIFVLALIWLGGSAAMAALMPWRSLDREDAWLCWAIVLGWPAIAAIGAVELAYEHFMPRVPWWLREPGP
jgi:hypothetical protein